MSAITVSPIAADPTWVPTGGARAGRSLSSGSIPDVQPLRPSRPMPAPRPSRGSGRGRSPLARPRTAIAPPRLQSGPRAQARGCTGEAAKLRLTDRGIAVILVAGLMVVVASLVVVGATALRVTGENYRPTSQVQTGSVPGDQVAGADFAP